MIFVLARSIFSFFCVCSACCGFDLSSAPDSSSKISLQGIRGVSSVGAWGDNNQHVRRTNIIIDDVRLLLESASLKYCLTSLYKLWSSTLIDSNNCKYFSARHSNLYLNWFLRNLRTPPTNAETSTLGRSDLAGAVCAPPRLGISARLEATSNLILDVSRSVFSSLIHFSASARMFWCALEDLKDSMFADDLE